MQYTVIAVEEKKPGWKVATLRDLDNITTGDVSLNETNPKGDLQWPQFKDFSLGAVIEGNLWKNPTSGKYSLFPPKPRTGAYGARGGGSAAVTKAQDHKAELIEKAQDKKHDAIKLAGAMRDATLITLASLKDAPFPTDSDFKEEWTKWVKWLIGQSEQPFI